MLRNTLKFYVILTMSEVTFGIYLEEVNNVRAFNIPFKNYAPLIRMPRHVQLATETTLSHVLNTIARNYPDLKKTGEKQSLEKIKEQLRVKLMQYVKRRKSKLKSSRN